MVQVFSDNMSVVCALTTGVARDPLLMHLLRCLHFFMANFQIIIEAHHIAGVDNSAADALSRNKLDVFLSCSPQAALSPSPIPQSPLDMLLHNKPDWTSQLEENVSLYLGKALAPSTLRSYGTGQRRYIAFCQDANLQPLPLSEHTLCIFVAHLASEGLTYQTIKSYLSALRQYHIMSGRGDPFIGSAFPLLQYVLRGIKRSPTHAPRQPRLPITPAILRLLKVVWSPLAVSDPDYIMLWAACCLGFFGFMRAGEFTATSVGDFDPSTSLCISDMSVDDRENPSMVCVVLRQSKTDPFRKGISIYLGRTYADLCPVAAILAYIAVRPSITGLFSKMAPTSLVRSLSVV